MLALEAPLLLEALHPLLSGAPVELLVLLGQVSAKLFPVDGPHGLDDSYFETRMLALTIPVEQLFASTSKAL